MMATLCMLMLVIPAMATDGPIDANYTLAEGYTPAAKSDAATEASLGAQEANLGYATPANHLSLEEMQASWQPAVGYQTPRMQMTNAGEERLYEFKGHVLTAPDTLAPATRILYAPSEGDNPTFRADVAACTGATVDYFDAISGTPDVALLSTYDCVLVWVNSSFADNVLYGDNLAAYVDGGGKVILGQWCYFSDQLFGLAGAIMTSAYCPVTTSTSGSSGAYDADGTDCVHGGVAAYDTQFLDVATLVAGASSDGTFNDVTNSLAVAWRADRMVYYSPGNTGGHYGTGDWAQLFCNECDCTAGTGDVDCACAATYSAGDRVVATASNPQGASGLSQGWGGTVISGNSIFTNTVLLVSWDDWQLGHDGNGYAECPVDSLSDTSGYWVDCPDVTPSVNVSCACGGAWNTGDRVMALIDNPDSQPDVYAGDHGTVIAGSTTLGSSRLLISWDGLTSGHDGNGFADCPVVALDNTSGWWVDCSMVAPVTAGGPTIAVALDATPDNGFVPFVTQFTAQLNNLTTENRRAAGNINVVIASGAVFTNWRAGWTNLSSLENFSTSWNTNFPAVPTVIGVNTFELFGVDVTPAPFNQPPYAPSGDTDTDVATVTAN